MELQSTLVIFVADVVALVSTTIQALTYVRHFPLSSMLRAVISDVTLYFFTVFLSHVLLVATMETARVSFQSSSSLS